MIVMIFKGWVKWVCKMKNKPFISIVIPTRDRPMLVAEVLKFISNQSFTNYEVIVSDNGINSSCFSEVVPYLADGRFTYKKPAYPMDMCTHWDFAIEGVSGEYLTVFCEKFMLRYDALQCIFDLAQYHSPDIITWQFDFFDVTVVEKDKLLGSYHPLVKPTSPIKYSAQSELERRFSFDFPSISRHKKNSDSYGKLYSGCVKTHIINRVKQLYGRVFYPMSPDFTSMFAILNESEKCIDIAQSLMLVVNMQGTSNGEATKKSAVVSRQFIAESEVDFQQYVQQLPLPGYWIGHNVSIASDMLLIQKLAPNGPIKKLTLDISALAFWAQIDFNQVSDWGDVERDKMQTILLKYIADMSNISKKRLDDNSIVALQPNLTEIYHSGLEKLTEFNPDTSAIELAELHWIKGIAPPRKNISLEPVALEQALQYFYEYNLRSCELLGIDLKEVS